MADDGVQVLQNLVGIFGQKTLGMLIVNLKRILELPGLHEGVGECGDGAQVVVDGQELARKSAGVRQTPRLQVSLQEIAKAVGIGIEVGDLLQGFDGCFRISSFEQIAALHEQRIAVAGIEGKHALQNFFCTARRAFGAQSLSGSCENLPGFILLAQADVDFRQADAHGGVFRIHFQNLLEDADRVFKFAGFQELFGDLQVLGAGVVEQSLLGVELGQFQHALKRWLELADFLVHGDGLDRETLSGIGIAYGLETFGGFVGFAEAGVEIANGVGDGKVFGVRLENFFVLGDGILHLALLDILLRRAEDLLFVEPETERHMSTNSSPWFCRERFAEEPLTEKLLHRESNDGSWEVLPGGTSHWPNSFLEMAGRTMAIVRLGGWKCMVTKDYQKGVYVRVTLGIRGGTAGVAAVWYKSVMWQGTWKSVTFRRWPARNLFCVRLFPSATKLAWRRGYGLVSLTSRLFTSWLNL